MNTGAKIKELNDELRAVKTAYEQNAYNLILYDYVLDIEEEYFISKTVTLDTEDGSNAIISLEGATYTRMPYEGGARIYVYNRQGDRIVLHSMQKGTVTIT